MLMYQSTFVESVDAWSALDKRDEERMLYKNVISTYPLLKCILNPYACTSYVRASSSCITAGIQHTREYMHIYESTFPKICQGYQKLVYDYDIQFLTGFLSRLTLTIIHGVRHSTPSSQGNTLGSSAYDAEVGAQLCLSETLVQHDVVILCRFEHSSDCAGWLQNNLYLS